MNEGTLKVAKIEDHRPQPTATHTISYVLDGFQITSVIETAAPIRQIVDKLKSIGATPSSFKSPVGDLKDGVCFFKPPRRPYLPVPRQDEAVEVRRLALHGQNGRRLLLRPENQITSLRVRIRQGKPGAQSGWRSVPTSRHPVFNH